MATVYLNGFEWNSFYENILSWGGGSTAIVTIGSTSNSSIPRSGNYCLFIRGTDSFVRWQINPLNEFYFQVALKLSSSSHDGGILKWTSDATTLGSLTFDPVTQKLSVYSGDKITKLATSTSQLLYNQWYLVELHIILHPSSGSVEMRIDGLSQFLFTGATTPSLTTANMFYFVGVVSATSSTLESSRYWVDDVIINNTLGDTNNTWPNGAKIVLLFPNGRGASSQWEKISGIDNYVNVDQYPVLDPSTYLYTNLTQRLDLYLVKDLPLDAYDVNAVRIDAWALKNSGSALLLNLAMKAGASIFISPDYDLGISYSLSQWLHQMNPGTSTDWTVNDVKLLQSGIRSIIPE